ncbi:recombinase family protein [Enterobacter hormaechei]|uniref:recombinase family protein n=1 Tax=Enterobacter hormaechei TaxID=158836 RepID=UPI000F67DDC0|nr:recombinase family protein [Enterobacter hormaechei]HCI9654585.1 recombinase family protein [Enterobacter hormaechei subsp. xiangfangensis]MDV5574041.1 recombinase family protein [Enterobacter hormaechei]RSA10905.1 recombinase family protein [Enterobacter hormaechei]RSA18890.1 recombinase family protein [Enterobacter hormaechei]HDV8310276.1 recombinase family protein [Enterobacter hormaechei]
MASENDKNHKVRVAQYLRMSTDHQQYSLHNQSEYIKDYAEKNNMEIAYTYDDAGKSGVSIIGRHSLQQLLSDVEQKKIDIQAVLFYDVSRFGRFQNSDEAAYYSFLFERNGVDLIYCSEPIPTKDFPLESSVILNIKRSSAAYHSRNLSEKVFIGQVNLIKLGYHQGGMAGYGLRRLLVDENGIAKEILGFRKRKSIQTDRVILIPGPKNEIKIVNSIYDLFIDDNMPEFIIAERLNEQNIPAENGTLWTRAKIHQILTNEKYIGNNIYNKTSSKLKSRLVKNPKNEWVRCDKAYKPIITKKKYNKAQEIIQLRSVHLTNEELLEKLKQKLESNGKLSGFIIDEDDTGPSSSVYRTRFGGLLRAYTLIGYKPEHDYSYIQINEALRSFYSGIIEDFKGEILKSNCYIDEYKYAPMLYINDELLISVLITKCTPMKSGKLRWKVRFDNSQKADITIVIRMDSQNISPLDFYIIPKIENEYSKMCMTETNNIRLDLYRFDNLDKLLQIITRMKVRELYAA